MTLATKPLANSAAASVPPNLMFVLDTSGSMGWDYSPDYVEGGNTSSFMCYDSGDLDRNNDGDGTNDAGSTPRISDDTRWPCLSGLDTSRAYDPPFMTPDFNKQYYNPDFTYKPGVDSAGVSLGSQSSGATSGWTAVKTNPYAGAGTTNLVSNFPFARWCRAFTTLTFSTVNSGSTLTVLNAKDDSGANLNLISGTTIAASGATATDRNRNMAATVRDAINARTSATGYWAETVTGSNVVTLYARPGVKPAAGFITYTFTGTVTMTHAVDLSSCVSNTAGYAYPDGVYKYRGTNGTGNPYYFRLQTTEYCTDTRMTSCIAATAPTATHPIPAKVRFCKNPSGTAPLTDCQSKFDATAGYTTAKYLGFVITTAGGKAFGTISIGAVAPGQSINSVTVNGVEIMTGPMVTATSTDTPSTIAARLRTSLSTTIYDTSVSGPTVTITSKSVGTADNGKPIVVTTSALATLGARATATLTLTKQAVSEVKTYRLPDIVVGGFTITSGTTDFTGDLSSDTDLANFAAVVAGRVTMGGYSATASGNVITITAPVAGSSYNGITPTLSLASMGQTPATGTITVFGTTAGKTRYRIDSISAGAGGIAGSTTVSNIDLTDPADMYTAAQQIALSIGSGFSATVVTPPVPNNVVQVTALTPGTVGNLPLSVSVPSPVGPSANLEFTRVDRYSVLDQITVAGVNLLGSSLGGTTSCSNSGVSGSVRRTDMATCVRAAINARTAITGFSAGAGSSGSDSVTVTGPVSLIGASPTPTFAISVGSGTITITGGSTTSFSGGYLPMPVTVTGLAGGTDFNLAPATATAFAGGINPTGLIPHSVENMNNGNTGSTIETRAGTGLFQRCDLKPDQSCIDASGAFVGNNGSVPGGRFPRASTRTDCFNPAYCTYNEEMQNFANWYAYYRTRMQAMKTAAGTAFATIGTDFRVGLMSIWSSSTADAQYLKVDSFDAAHKTSWYTKFYSAPTSGGTPLRRALTRASKMFAHTGPFGDDDPVQYSCQQNFVMLTTDGYWNSDSCSELTRLNGTTEIGQQDNLPTVRPPFFDGGSTTDVCVGGSSTTPSSAGNLADIAYYFYETDLRTATLGNCLNGRDGIPNPDTGTNKHDTCLNNVAGSSTDTATHQHVTTFTLGLGVDGNLEYREDYPTAPSGDFFQISRGTLNWPKTQPNNQTAVDDLWHAAVNGRGRYLSAQNPALLAKDLNTALLTIKSQVGAGASASSSNLDATATDTSVFVPSYTTVQWTGNLTKQDISDSGALDPAADWCVEDIPPNPALGVPPCVGKLKSQVSRSTDFRNIWISPNPTKQFQFANLSATEQAFFDPVLLSQYPALTPAEQADATGTTLVQYLRGQWRYEDQAGNTLRMYRDRVATMGDAVGSRPVYVRSPRFDYEDPGHSAFKTAMASRPETVYMGTNDGMLHAFNAAAGAGQERWAFVPKAVMPEMWRLADYNYATNHRYYVDGSLVAGDICTANCTDAATAVWKTILVGGFGGGGKGYYALDVTDPLNPSTLWEFSNVDLGYSFDEDMGYSFGNAIITKRLQADGTKKWVVVVSSGYNNQTGSGQGVLFVLDAATGVPLPTGPYTNGKIPTGVGTPATPSGLAKIDALVRNRRDNTASYVYGGDLLGNLWRFKIDEAMDADPVKESKTRVAKIATFEDATGKLQPVTTKPVITSLDDIDSTTYLAVATGQMLQEGDLTNTDQQTLYAFVDLFDTNGYQTVGLCAGCTKGARDQLTQVTLAADGTTDARGRRLRKTTMPGVEPTLTKVQGCYVDFPDQGERVNVDMLVVLGTLSVLSNVPTSGVCQASGYSYYSAFNYKTCEGLASFVSAPAFGVGMFAFLSGKQPMVGVTYADATFVSETMPEPNPPKTFQGRRIGWRVLFD